MAEAAMADDKPAVDDGKLSVTDLVRMFEESEESTLTARGQAERDRDYYDNIQYTADELATLKKRGQPAVIDNRIKSKVDYLVGLEKSQRIDPRALPRTPQHEEDADGASQALKYVADSQDYDTKRSAIWRNLLIEGCGGISVAVEPSKYSKPMNTQQMLGSTAMTPPTEYDIVLRRWAWDRMFWDPHSSETDFSDAGYLGGVVWMDYDDALAMYKDGREALDATMSDRGAMSNTYDDKPKFRVWADKKRKRVRIVQIWVKRDNKWYFAEFTKGGILKAGPSPYVDDKGESDCEMIFASAYVNRENERYGLVREMITLQDAINKRGSKSLHLLNTAQIVAEDGAVDDVEKARREAQRPDGYIKLNPGFSDKFKFETRTDLAEGHFKLLQDAKNSIDLKGPNATQMGDKAQGSSAASGRAIIASQQGGMIQLGDLMDNLRHMDKRVFRAIWNRIRQFWTAEKWVRTTDDERNVKWVGVNVDPQRIQMAMQQNPQLAEKIGGVVGNVAELDCDIIIDEVPDSTVPQIEQFQALAELKKFDKDGEIPFRAIVAAMPSLKDRQKFLTMMDEHAEKNAQKAQGLEQLKLRGAVAEVEKNEQGAFLANAQGQKALAEAGVAGHGEQQPMPVMEPQPYEIPPELQNAQAMADIADTHAAADQKRAQAFKAGQEARLAPHKMAQEANDRAADRTMRAKAPA